MIEVSISPAQRIYRTRGEMRCFERTLSLIEVSIYPAQKTYLRLRNTVTASPGLPTASSAEWNLEMSLFGTGISGGFGLGDFARLDVLHDGREQRRVIAL